MAPKSEMDAIEPHLSPVSTEDHSKSNEEIDVFTAADGTNRMRTVSWVQTSAIMLKMTFGLGVLGIPKAMHILGLVTCLIMIFLWASVNTYSACLLGQFNAQHPSVHTVADAAFFGVLEWRKNRKHAELAREIVTWWFLVGWVMSSSSAILSLTIAFNAISKHATCTVVWGVVATLWVWLLSCIPTLEKVGWIAWGGFASIMAAILTVSIAVGLIDRPAAAPPGPVDKALSAWPASGTSFTDAWVTCLAIYFAYANTPGFVPLIAEMRQPKKFNKAVVYAMSFITIATVATATTIWYFCGQWVASPSLGSAGPTIKIAAYAIAFPALSASGCIFVHVGGKALMVKFLRNSRHLTQKSAKHWMIWVACNLAIAFPGFLLAQCIPFFHSLSALISALGFCPLGICLPALIWFAQNGGWWKSTPRQLWLGILHIGMLIVGCFITFVGSYAVIAEIIHLYAIGDVSGVFTCDEH